MKKALLVIDMQNVCVGEKHAAYFKYDNDVLIKEVNKVIDANKNNLVIYIKNVMKKNIFNKLAPFQAYEGTEENAFTNLELNEFLKEHNVESLEIVGVDGGGCVALTALGAKKYGYRVIINEKAIGTMFERNKNKYFNKLKEIGAEFV